MKIIQVLFILICCFASIRTKYSNLSISPKCLSWALQVKNGDMSSFGIDNYLSTGTNINDLGDMDFCEKRSGNKYYLMSAQVSLAPLPFGMGICLPNFCTVDEINSFMPLFDMAISSQITKLTGFNVTAGATLFDPRKSEQTYDAGSYIAIVFFFGLFAICALISAYNHKFKPEQFENQTIIQKVANSFDLMANFRNLFSMSNSLRNNPLKAFNAIRFFAIGWVILGHTYLELVTKAPNVTYALKQFQEISFFNIVIAGFYAVDVFFWMGGFFVAYAGIPKLRKSLSIGKYLMFIVHRVFRVWPALAVLVFFNGYILYGLGSGPYWGNVKIASDNCRNYGYYDLIFATNFIVNKKPQCIGWGWYIAMDMQIFIFTPLILFFHSKKRLFGYISSLLFVIVTCITSLSVSFARDYKALVNVPALMTSDEAVYFYFRPWYRADPYFFGVICGMLYMDVKDDENNFIRRFYKSYENLKSFFTYILGCGIMTFLIFIVYPLQKSNDNWNQSQHSFFMTFNRLTFVIGLFIVMIPQIFLKESLVREVLGARFFDPTAKLSYCIYLVHYVVIWVIFNSVRKAIYYTDIDFISRSIEILFISFFAAIVLHLLAEKPVANLERIWSAPPKKRIENPETVKFLDKNEVV